MLLARQAASSSGLIGRDASEISVSPLQNRLNPPPVPEKSTVKSTLPAWLPNSSASASIIGKTVDDPSAVILPLSEPRSVPGVYGIGVASCAVARLGIVSVAANATAPKV